MKNESKDFSIIDKELTIDGTVSTKGRLIIKGVVKGTLVGQNVIIAEEGAVYADAKVGSITIGGIFEGEVRGVKRVDHPFNRKLQREDRLQGFCGGDRWSLERPRNLHYRQQTMIQRKYC